MARINIRAAAMAVCAAAWLAAGTGCMTSRSGSPLDGYDPASGSMADETRKPHFADAEVDSDGTIYYSPGAGGRRVGGAEPGEGEGATVRRAPSRAVAGREGPDRGAGGSWSGGGTASSLRVGDFVQVMLKGVPQSEEAAVEFSLNEDGMIAMPHLPPIRAVGKTPGELEREISDMYQSQRIFTNPKVSVMVGGRYINVMGEVRSPQRVLFTSDLTVLRAVAASGGFTDYANKRAVRVHRGDDIIEVHAGRALKDPRADLSLKPGDTVEVRRSIF